MGSSYGSSEKETPLVPQECSKKGLTVQIVLSLGRTGAGQTGAGDIQETLLNNP